MPMLIVYPQTARKPTLCDELARSYALAGVAKGQVRRVGSVRDDTGVYTWHITFAPRFCAGVIIQTLRPATGQEESENVFWLSSWQRPDSHRYEWNALAEKARRMEQEQFDAIAAA